MEFDVTDLYIDSMFVHGDNKTMVWWNGFTSIFWGVGHYFYYRYLNDGIHDVVLFWSAMIFYPQNLFFWMIVLAYAGLPQDL